MKHINVPTFIYGTVIKIKRRRKKLESMDDILIARRGGTKNDLEENFHILQTNFHSFNFGNQKN